MSFLETLAYNMRAFPDKVALEFVQAPQERLTYAELHAAVQRTMQYLHGLGLQPGERVALQLPKCLEFITLHLAILNLGAISLPLNPAYPPEELAYYLSDSGASLFFTDIAYKDRLQPLIPRLGDLKQCVYIQSSSREHFDTLLAQGSGESIHPVTSDSETTAVIIYTSGTTGRPKGAEITHGNITENLAALHQAWGWQASDVLLHVLPIFHVHGLFVALHGALNAGATTLLMRSFEPGTTMEMLIGRNCSVFMGVPTIHKRLLAVPEASRFNLSQMRLMTSGSDRLPDEVFSGFQRTFGYTLLERYGMTETGMNLSNPLDGERRRGSVGLPLPGVEARIMDPVTGELSADGEVGEVQIRGRNVFKGYWRQPEKTVASFTPDGWFRSGDLGLCEPDGYFTLKGRAKDLIITGGLNVYPPEVERVISKHPAVAACAVIGCPDSGWGERVTAVVVLTPGQKASGGDLITFCRQRLAAYKAPKTVHFVDDLPRNAMGKVQKAVLIAELCPPTGK